MLYFCTEKRDNLFVGEFADIQKGKAMPKQKLSPWIKDALKVSELEYQLYEIDLADGVFANEPELLQADAEYLVGEARNRIDLVRDQLQCIDSDYEDYAILKKDERQLCSFIKKWKGKET